MTREYLDNEIRGLHEQVALLEKLVSNAALEAVDSLLENDDQRSKAVYLGDKKINALRFEIESACLVAIATQQPLATDLRTLASILEVVTELERMGDYAKGIAKVNLIIEKKSTKAKAILGLKEMVDIATGMLHRAVAAFIAGDAEAARKIPQDDTRVDELYNQIFTGLVEDMLAKKKRIELASHLQMAAHHVERFADRVINICERTLFVVTGEMNELEESDDEWVLEI